MKKKTRSILKIFFHFKKSNIKEIVWYLRKFSYKFIILKKKRKEIRIFTSFFLTSNSIRSKIKLFDYIHMLVYVYVDMWSFRHGFFDGVSGFAWIAWWKKIFRLQGRKSSIVDKNYFLSSFATFVLIIRYTRVILRSKIESWCARIWENAVQLMWL